MARKSYIDPRVFDRFGDLRKINGATLTDPRNRDRAERAVIRLLRGD